VSSTLHAWKQRELQVVDGQFPLRQYLGGSERRAVFVTERGKPQAKKAAIKLVPVSNAAEGQLARWQAAAKLSHPNLLRLFESGRCQFDNEDYFYVVMEYAEEDLSQILPTRALSAAEANDMLPPVIDALQYLHGQGLVHGHLKPANIMAISDTLKLSTDGISRAPTAVADVQSAGVYEAPEAAKDGRSPATDVWSLGMTLVEVLTQRPPMREGPEGEPLIPQTIPALFREIAGHCLRRDPQKRWTVEQIKERLRAETPPKRPLRLVTAPRHTVSDDVVPKKWWRPVLAGLILLVCVFVALKFFTRRSETESALPSRATLAEGKGASGSESAIPRKPEAGSSGRGAMQPANGSSAIPSSGGGGQSDIVEQVVPDISRGASNTVQGTIKVNVRVNLDPSGNVTDARFERRGPSEYFARKSMEAARKWKFATNAARTWVLHFEFRRSGTRVIPQPVGS
jgi:TonB family protein